VAVHLFVVYCGLLSFITPPVALAAYAAANIAGSSPFRTGLQAMRLGTALYFLPFLFLFDPCLILHGAPLTILQSVTTAIIGIFLIASALEGYLVGVGRLAIPLRVLCLGSGVLLCLAGWRFDLIGIAIAVISAVVSFITAKASRKFKLPW
jgi:TRAP-type uncharacterized transport system fused permease subunit